MYFISKKFKVAIGHRLLDHPGKCGSFHGHNFIIEIQVSSTVLNKHNMIIDFSELEEIVEVELEALDHAALLNRKDNMLEAFKQYNQKIQLIGEGDPTAEALSYYLFYQLKDAFLYLKIKLEEVKVWENDSSMACYREDQWRL